MNKHFSWSLVTVVVVDFLILFFTSVVTADINDANTTMAVFAFAFALMIIIAVVGYRDYQRKKSKKVEL